ncbi:hypothetical protein PG996_000644 [Apiospora saccharicola]|uniref:Uncharacterized protein n=1 Tax=Apiospora saccharicola TaxID=335842 RepID=A0ABR1WEL2_9PEZI
MERAAKIRAYLEDELSVIREQIQSQWNLDYGLFLTETGDVNNTYVYDALDRVKRWHVNLEKRAKADEAFVGAPSNQVPKGHSTKSGSDRQLAQHVPESAAVLQITGAQC